VLAGESEEEEEEEDGEDEGEVQEEAATQRLLAAGLIMEVGTEPSLGQVGPNFAQEAAKVKVGRSLDDYFDEGEAEDDTADGPSEVGPTVVERGRVNFCNSK
jgi:hypothetical protein